MSEAISTRGSYDLYTCGQSHSPYAFNNTDHNQ